MMPLRLALDGQNTTMTTNPSGLNRVTQWLRQRQLGVLNNAFSDAQAIKALEDQYYQGGKIAYAPEQSKTVYDYVRSLRDRKLLQIRANLTQFRLNSFLLNQSPQAESETLDQSGVTAPVSTQAAAQDVLAKLDYIELVIGKYRESPEDDLAQAAAMMTGDQPSAAKGSPTKGKAVGKEAQATAANILDVAIVDTESDNQKRSRVGFLGGGLLSRDLDPDYEQKVVQELRLQRKQDQVALRWLAILIFVPLLVALLARNFVLEPLLGNYSDRNPSNIELSSEIREEFALELNNYKEQLEVKELLGLVPEITPAMKQEELSAKATELWREAREQELSGLKNLMADGIALVAFAGLVYFNRSRLIILRSATNRAFLGLDNTVKVFVFILLTDTFVGFHSAEGWTVILNGIGRHFGLSENEAAVGLFIATVPVILDACIKFWIFTYLTRFSPSSSAIYERMNT